MAKQIVLVTPDTSTSGATFRATFSPISTALQALFVKVPQAGEINLATVSKPGSANTSAGFEVYRLNDAMQATAPIFFKIEYGVGSLLTRPALWITVGKGADGSGNITGTLLARVLICQSWGVVSATPKNCYLGNGDGSCLVIALFPSDDASFTGSGGCFYAMERSRDAGGIATGAGIHQQYPGFSESYHTSNTVDYVAATKNTTSYGAVPIPYSLSSDITLSNGVNTPVFTGMVITPSRESWVPTAIIGCAMAEFGVGVVVTSLVNGIDYLAMGAASAYSDMAIQPYSASLLRWD